MSVTTISNAAVAIMAKAPWPGQVKTRLCPPLSPEEAAQLYRAFLLDKIGQIGALQAVPVISYAPAEAKATFEALAPSHFSLILQQGRDLGARLLSTFEQIFSRGCLRALAIDSDTPTLPTVYLERALDLLADTRIDVVLGPSEDGGYYLIGLRQPHRELFEEISWSTSHVLSQTLQRSQEQQLQVACLEPWYDVDTPDDLKRLRLSLEQPRAGQAQHTRRFLMEQTW